MHAITSHAAALIQERTPGQGWSEQGYLKVVGIGLGIAIIIVAFRYIFGKK
jgi:hypothetical protein